MQILIRCRSLGGCKLLGWRLEARVVCVNARGCAGATACATMGVDVGGGGAVAVWRCCAVGWPPRRVVLGAGRWVHGWVRRCVWPGARTLLCVALLYFRCQMALRRE
jgi:hypothetical protein